MFNLFLLLITLVTVLHNEVRNVGYSDVVDGGANDDLLQVDYSSKNNGAGIHLGWQGADVIYSRGGAGDKSELVKFSSIERFDITGTQYADVFEGRSGNDIFNGGAGNDILNGSAGNDILNGGGLFEFESAKVAFDDGALFTVNDGGWSSFNSYPRQLGDVNGDGRADIVGFGYGAVVVALGQTDGTFQTISGYSFNDFATQHGWSSFDKYPRHLADVNGDGRADIVAFGSGAVHVALGQANGTFQMISGASIYDFTTQQGWESFDKYPRHLADVNGDGRADIVGFGSDAVHVALGQTDGKFGATKVAFDDGALFTVNDGGWSSFNSYPRHLADVNGDGRADIVGFGYGAVVVALGQTDGTFQTISGYSFNDFATQHGWESFDKYPRHLADVNGDDRADIVGFGSGAVHVALAQPDGNDTLTGGTGKDALTGGLGTDRFDYRNLADSLLNNFDVITDFNANEDKFAVSNPLSEFFSVFFVTTLDVNNIGRILTSTDFQANAAARFQLLSFNKNMTTRTFVAINDGIAGFDANTDAIIEVTGLTGTLGLNNFTTTLA